VTASATAAAEGAAKSGSCCASAKVATTVKADTGKPDSQN
jgi:hypothetical protein